MLNEATITWNLDEYRVYQTKCEDAMAQGLTTDAQIFALLAIGAAIEKATTKDPE